MRRSSKRRNFFAATFLKERKKGDESSLFCLEVSFSLSRRYLHVIITFKQVITRYSGRSPKNSIHLMRQRVKEACLKIVLPSCSWFAASLLCSLQAQIFACRNDSLRFFFSSWNDVCSNREIKNSITNGYGRWIVLPFFHSLSSSNFCSSGWVRWSVDITVETH